MAGRGPTVKVEGAARLRRTMRQAGLDLEDLKAAHARAVKIAEGAVQAPRRSGRLAGTVRSAGTKTAGILRAGRASVPYAGPIHWGWKARGITAQPFLSDAAQRSEPRWLPVYTEAVDAALDQVKGI